MKTITLFFVALCMIMASSLTAQNLVPNGGFEEATWVNGTQPQEWIFNNGGGQTEWWTCGTSDTYANPTGVIPAEGNKMGYVKCKTTTTYAWQTIKKPESNCVRIVDGNSYIFKFKVYSLLGAGNTATPKIKTYVEEKGNSWTTIDKTVYDIVPGAWQSFSVNFNFDDPSVTTGTSVDVSLGFIITGNEANTVFFFDDVQIVSAITSLNNAGEIAPVNIYPNPVIDRCKILNGNYTTAKVYNLAGLLVAENKIDVNNEIDFSTLASGCYMVKLNGATEEVFKVVKK